MKSGSLSSRHYAAKWIPVVRPVEEINALGCDYADLPEGIEKQQKLFEIAQCFHGYLLKYLTMICLGHVPMWGDRVNKDVEPFLRYFLQRGAPATKVNLLTAVRRLHLGFKGMDTDEVYDVLMEQLLKAVRRYDPAYTDKVKLITEIIDEELRKHDTFTAADINSHLDFDSDSYLRLLVRRGFLVAGRTKGKDRARYARSGSWPPPVSFFKSGPIGLTYYLQTWFRYYVQQWIESRMSEIEAREGVYSLDHGYKVATEMLEQRYSAADRNVPDASGEFTDAAGRSWAADVSLINSPLDISKMTLEWVSSTNDPLFCDLTRKERHTLYLVFAREMSWSDIAVSFGVTVRTVKNSFTTIISLLQEKVSAAPPFRVKCRSRKSRPVTGSDSKHADILLNAPGMLPHDSDGP